MGLHGARKALLGERKALAAFVLALYALFFLVSALNAPPELTNFFGAMAGLYGVAFFGLVAGYFWARWFAMGLGAFGLMTAAMAIWQIGLDFIPLFLGGTHALVALTLWGDGMAVDFDGRSDWRERFHMDENATRRLGKAIIRAGMTLPMLLAYGLAPRSGMGESLLAAVVVGVAVLGIAGLFRMRTWGVLLMAAGAIGLMGTAMTTAPVASVGPVSVAGHAAIFHLLATGVIAAVLLMAAVAPLAGPIIRFVRR